MVDLLVNPMQFGVSGYAGVYCTRKYFSVGREAPAAVAARKQKKAMKALSN